MRLIIANHCQWYSKSALMLNWIKETDGVAIVPAMKYAKVLFSTVLDSRTFGFEALDFRSRSPNAYSVLYVRRGKKKKSRNVLLIWRTLGECCFICQERIILLRRCVKIHITYLKGNVTFTYERFCPHYSWVSTVVGVARRKWVSGAPSVKNANVKRICLPRSIYLSAVIYRKCQLMRRALAWACALFPLELPWGILLNKVSLSGLWARVCCSCGRRPGPDAAFGCRSA